MHLPTLFQNLRGAVCCALSQARPCRCFGLFDTPKAAESTPVYGSLRQRPTAGLTKRLNAARYLALAITPHVPTPAEVQKAGEALKAVGAAKRGAGQPTLQQLFSKAAKKQRA